MSLFQGILGGLSLLTGMNANRSADRYNRSAASLNDARAQGVRDALGIARDYDPEAETQAAVDFASKVAESAIARSLSTLNTRFRNAGGQPGGDTMFRHSSQQAADRALDPLKGFAADQKSSETARRLGMLSQAVNSGGDVAGTYMNLSSSTRPDLGGPMAMIAGAFDGPQTPAGAASTPIGGSGAVQRFANTLSSGASRFRDRFKSLEPDNNWMVLA